MLPPKTLGRTLNLCVESGAKGLQKLLNVTHFVDLDYSGFGGGIPLPARNADPIQVGKCPDHILFIVRSSDIGEIRLVANWIVSRRRDLERDQVSAGKPPSDELINRV